VPRSTVGTASYEVQRMDARTARGLAWALGGLAIASLAAGAVVGVTSNTLSDALDIHPGLDVLFAVTLATFPVMGVLIAIRQPGNPIGWLFCVIGLAFGLTTFAGTYGDAAPPLPSHEWGTLVAGAASGAILPLIALVMLLFPNGKLLSHVAGEPPSGSTRSRRSR
jgi:hypothetical protein